MDRAGAKLVLTGIRDLFPQVGLVWADGGHVNVVDTGLVGWRPSTRTFLRARSANHGVGLAVPPAPDGETVYTFP